MSRENRRPFERVEAIKTPLTFSTPLIVYCQLVPLLGIIIVDLVEKRLVSYIAGIAAGQLLPFIRSGPSSSRIRNFTKSTPIFTNGEPDTREPSYW